MPPKYQKKFRREWLTMLNIKGGSLNMKMIRKKYCNNYCVLAGKLSDLFNHSESQKHKSSASIRGSCWRKFDFNPKIAESSKKQEISLALFTCQHSSNNSVDHLTELCKCNLKMVNKYGCTERSAQILLKTFYHRIL
ncbi:hypothetical protein CVS40_8786 [Lucilia cuprina]|nr:hypothetical protein CVS40_8786 [Lucilia cuprina]